MDVFPELGGRLPIPPPPSQVLAPTRSPMTFLNLKSRQTLKNLGVLQTQQTLLKLLTEINKVENPRYEDKSDVVKERQQPLKPKPPSNPPLKQAPFADRRNYLKQRLSYLRSLSDKEITEWRAGVMETLLDRVERCRINEGTHFKRPLPTAKTWTVSCNKVKRTREQLVEEAEQSSMHHFKVFEEKRKKAQLRRGNQLSDTEARFGGLLVAVVLHRSTCVFPAVLKLALVWHRHALSLAKQYGILWLRSARIRIRDRREKNSFIIIERNFRRAIELFRVSRRLRAIKIIKKLFCVHGQSAVAVRSIRALIFQVRTLQVWWRKVLNMRTHWLRTLIKQWMIFSTVGVRVSSNTSKSHKRQVRNAMQLDMYTDTANITYLQITKYMGSNGLVPDSEMLLLGLLCGNWISQISKCNSKSRLEYFSKVTAYIDIKRHRARLLNFSSDGAIVITCGGSTPRERIHQYELSVLRGTEDHFFELLNTSAPTRRPHQRYTMTVTDLTDVTARLSRVRWLGDKKLRRH